MPIRRHLRAARHAGRGHLTHPFAASALAVIALTAASRAQDFTARPTLPAESLPQMSAQDGQFELLTVTPGNLERTPAWGTWLFSSLAGIAHETSALAASNPPAPTGDRVAYIAGKGWANCVTNVDAGMWRVRYRLAAREVAGTLDEQTVRVTLGGVTIAHEDSLQRFYGAYTTRPFYLTAAGLQQIRFTGTGDLGDVALLDNVVLEPVREWSDPNSWDSTATSPPVPQAGNSVLIPAGSVISMRGDCAAGAVESQGELIVADETASLTANSVLVIGAAARFEVGRREAPVAANSQFELTLTGPYVPGQNHKFLMAEDSGRIDMHGNPKTSWTQLTATGNPGDYSIQVANASGWKVGDEIVIAGSEAKASSGVLSTGFQSFAERFSVNAINGNTITLGLPLAWFFTDSLKNLHIASTKLYPTTGPKRWKVEMHAEVGMLTHNVRVTSVPATIPGLSQAAKSGGHIMIRGKANDSVGQAYFSSVELTKLGQTKVAGRYPIHWHMCRDNADGQYIVNSSIHDTFHRAVTIHGTDNIRCEHNVGFRNPGHAFFLEDGSEQDNHLIRNLAIETLKPAIGDALLASDILDAFQNRSPAAFWITNPQNRIVGNVATDTIGTGFWFALPTQVQKLSNGATPGAIAHNDGIAPNRLDLDVFRNNVAHGCRQGFDVHDGLRFDPMDLTDGNDLVKNLSWLPASGEARIENFLAYGCDTGIYTGDGEHDPKIVFDHAILVDNRLGTRFASSDRMEDSLFVADTGNGVYDKFPVASVTRIHEAYRLYDGAPRVDDSHFDGFHVQGFSRLFGSNSASLRRTNHTFAAWTFEPKRSIAQPRCEFVDFSAFPGGGTGPAGPQSPFDPRSWGFSIWDDSGELTGSAGSIIGNHPWMLDGQEIAYDNGPGDTSNAFFTPQRFAHLFVREPGVTAAGLKDVLFSRLHASAPLAQFLHNYVIDQQKQVPVIVNKSSNTAVDDYTYVLDWPNAEPTSLRLRLGSAFPDDAVVVRLNLQEPSVGVSLDGSPIALTTNFVDILDRPQNGTSLMHVTSTGDLYLRLMNLPTGKFLDITW